MDIAAKAVLLAQGLRDQDELLHRVIGGADDARGQEQALDVIPFIEFHREPDERREGVRPACGRTYVTRPKGEKVQI
jgi:hypothetical protein